MTDFYVQPETGGGSPSGSGTEGDPFNGWADVSFTGISDGDTLYALDGTYAGEFINVGKTFTSTDPLTIRALNRRQAVMDGEDTVSHGCIGNAKEGIVINGFEFKNYVSNGVLFLGQTARTTSGCKVFDCYIHDCGASGINIGFASSFQDLSATPFDNCDVAHNLIEDVGSFGIAIYGPCRGATIRRNIVRRAALTATSWGIYAAGDHLKNISHPSLPNWVNDSGDIWSLDLSGTNWSGKDIDRCQFNGRTPGSGPYALADGGSGTSPGVGEFTFDGTKCYIDSPADDPNGISVVFVFAHLESVVMEENIVTKTSIAGGDGIGMGFDHGAEDCEMRYCESLSNGGNGASLNTSVDCLVHDCYFASNGDAGISFPTTSGSNVRGYHISTEKNAVGIRVLRLASGDTVDLRNNASSELDNLELTDIDGTLTESYNLGPEVTGASSIVGKAIYTDKGHASPRSLGRSKGIYISGFHDVTLDADGKKYRRPPDMGRQANTLDPAPSQLRANRRDRFPRNIVLDGRVVRVRSSRELELIIMKRQKVSTRA